MNAVRQRIETGFDNARQYLAEQGITKDIADLYRIDPLQAEFIVRDVNLDMCRNLMGDAFESIDD